MYSKIYIPSEETPPHPVGESTGARSEHLPVLPTSTAAPLSQQEYYWLTHFDSLQPEELVYQRGMIKETHGDSAGALLDYDAASTLQPSNPVYLNAKIRMKRVLFPQDSALITAEYFQLFMSVATDPLIHPVKSLRQLKEYYQSLTCLKGCLQIMPENAALLGEMETLLQNMAAIASQKNYSQIPQLNCTPEQLMQSRVQYNRERKQFAFGILNLNALIQLAPEKAEYYSERGLLYLHLEIYEEALKNSNRAIELDPLNDRNYYYRSIIYQKLAQYDQALSDTTHAIHLRGEIWEYLEQRGIIYGQLGSFDDALNDLNRAVEISSATPYLLTQLGIIKEFRGDHSGALEEFRRALDLDPDNQALLTRCHHAYFNSQPLTTPFLLPEVSFQEERQQHTNNCVYLDSFGFFNAQETLPGDRQSVPNFEAKRDGPH